MLIDINKSAAFGFLLKGEIEDAARVDGANEFTLFLFVSVPLAGKAILSGAVLCFARALGEFGATLMFAGNIPGKTQTISTTIYVLQPLKAVFFWHLKMKSK